MVSVHVPAVDGVGPVVQPRRRGERVAEEVAGGVGTGEAPGLCDARCAVEAHPHLPEHHARECQPAQPQHRAALRPVAWPEHPPIARRVPEEHGHDEEDEDDVPGEAGGAEVGEPAEVHPGDAERDVDQQERERAQREVVLTGPRAVPPDEGSDDVGQFPDQHRDDAEAGDVVGADAPRLGRLAGHERVVAGHERTRGQEQDEGIRPRVPHRSKSHAPLHTTRGGHGTGSRGSPRPPGC